MAVTPTILSDLNDLAKDYFSDVYQSQINVDTPFKNQIGKLEKGTYTGRKMIFGIKTANGGGSANAGANKTLPAAQKGQYDQGEVGICRTYTRLALDLLAVEVTKKQEGSYRPAMSETMADRLAAHDLELNRQMFCNADGKLALIASNVGASATQYVGSDYGVANGGSGTRHIYAGDFLNLYDNSNALIGGRTVNSVDPTAGTVTLSSTITSTATTNYFTKATADDDNYSAGEANGLLAAVKSTVTFETIPATGRWKAKQDSNSGTARPINDALVSRMIAGIRAESRMTPNLAVTRPDIVLKYSEVFLPLRRINGQEAKLKAGYIPTTSIMHAGGEIPILEDLDCPDGRLFFLNTASVKSFDLVGSQWADADGIQFIRVTDKDAIEGYIRSYHNLCWIQRNCNGVIEDLETIPSIDRQGA